ncbi:MAG: transcription elongation factor GreA [Clostridia bacterium]|nr:transcription elongation factor GreA [Clostridia bacterium]
MADTRILTFKDKKNYEEQLEQLNAERKKVAEEIQIARGFGDLSENAEYDAAKAREAEVYGKINEIQGILNTAQFIDDSDVSSDTCALGTVVRVLDMTNNEEDEYTLVGYTESNPFERWISNESPIGKALTDTDGKGTGARVGDIVEANTPGGIVKMKVLGIRKREE